MTVDRERVEWESHEGMVTVYDCQGRYRGCMGSDVWDRIVGGAIEEAEARLAKVTALVAALRDIAGPIGKEFVSQDKRIAREALDAWDAE